MRSRDRSRVLVPLALLFVTLLLLTACGPTESELVIDEPWARAAQAGMMAMEDQSEDSDSSTMDGMEGDSEEGMHSGAVSAAYMAIRNTGGAADRLIGGTTDAANIVEIHTVEMEGDVMRMRPLADGLEIPAGESVTLQPGGFHVMLMDLQQDLVDGDTLALTLNFESGKQIEIQAEIRNP